MTRKMKIPPELEGEYTVRIMDMPLTSPGFVTYDDEDHANVYLNARYNRETNENTADHELTHIINDDIHNDDPIELVESRADASTGKRRLPPLMKARDLLPPQPHVAATPAPLQSRPNPSVPISPRQATVLLRAISELDDWITKPYYDF